MSPHAPVAVPDRSTVTPETTTWSAPAFATGRNGAPGLLCRDSSANAVRLSKTFSGSVVRLLSCRFSNVNDVSSSKTCAGKAVRLLPSRRSPVSPVSPSKSPACRLPRLLLETSRVPVMPARWASVTSAQSVTPETALTMASRTSGVRAQTSVSATLRVNSSLTALP